MARAVRPMGYDPAVWQQFERMATQVRTVGQAHALAVAALGMTRQAHAELAGSYMGGKFSDEAAAAQARAVALDKLGAVELSLSAIEASLRALRQRGLDAQPMPAWASPLTQGSVPLAIAGGVILGSLAPHVAAYEAKANQWLPRMFDALYHASGAANVLPFATGMQAVAFLALVAVFVAMSSQRRLIA